MDMNNLIPCDRHRIFFIRSHVGMALNQNSGSELSSQSGPISWGRSDLYELVAMELTLLAELVLLGLEAARGSHLAFGTDPHIPE